MSPGEWKPERDDAELVGEIDLTVWRLIRSWTTARQVWTIPETWRHIESRHGGQFDVSKGQALLATTLATPEACYEGAKIGSFYLTGAFAEGYCLMVAIKTLPTELWLESMYALRRDRLLRPTWRGRQLYERKR